MAQTLASLLGALPPAIICDPCGVVPTNPPAHAGGTDSMALLDGFNLLHRNFVTGVRACPNR